MNRKVLIAAFPVVALFAFVACGQQEGSNAVVASESDTVEQQSSPLMETPAEDLQHAASLQSKPVAIPSKATTKKSVAPSKPVAKAETLYVETEGAQGRVWGHVTMKGDRGTGTIHDWDENTLAVTVTRHGNELFAVDQNSRQYVFKLKQNKTQE